jgi:hypothetical protein
MLCHANSYWVGVIVFFWYLAAYGWRLVLVPSAYGYAAGLAVGFGPYAAVIATNWDEFNAQLQMFAIERVPGFSLATLWYHISHEPLRYRDWYFGLITNDITNPVLRLFQACAALGTLYLAWRMWRDRRTTVSVRPETLAAILLFGSVAIFAALIPNKALVYLPHLLVGFAIAAGVVMARALAFVPMRATALPPRALLAPAVVVFMVLQGAGAIGLYQYWYRLMRGTELRPYEQTHALLEAMVPPGPKYLIASPTFWLPFYDRPEIRFVAYTAAGPYDTVEPKGFFTRQRIFDFPQDRPFYLLVDETEWRSVLEDTMYDPYWRESWITYIRTACAPLRVAFGTSQGTIALYRCWQDRRARPVDPEYSFDGRTYSADRVAWMATPDELSAWQLYRADTRLERTGGRLEVSAPSGGGIYADVPVTPGTAYLLRADVAGVSAADLVSLHEMGPDDRPTRSQWLKLSDDDWFPSGTIVRPSTSSIRIYVYSESATDFSIGSLQLIRLTEFTSPE